jgi:hypothetical protein
LEKAGGSVVVELKRKLSGLGISHTV